MNSAEYWPDPPGNCAGDNCGWLKLTELNRTLAEMVMKGLGSGAGAEMVMKGLGS